MRYILRPYQCDSCFSDWEKVNIIKNKKQMSIINVVCGYAGSAELTFTTFSLHQNKKIIFSSIMDLENPRSIIHVYEKRRCRMAKHFSKKYGNKG